MKQIATKKKQTEEKMKKVFRLKLLKLCKTRPKQSRPDMLNFYVVLADHNKVIYAGRATTCRCKFKALFFLNKFTKKEDLLKIRVITGKKFEDFRKKRTGMKLWTFEKTSVRNRDPKFIN